MTQWWCSSSAFSSLHVFFAISFCTQHIHPPPAHLTSTHPCTNTPNAPHTTPRRQLQSTTLWALRCAAGGCAFMPNLKCSTLQNSITRMLLGFASATRCVQQQGVWLRGGVQGVSGVQLVSNNIHHACYTLCLPNHAHESILTKNNIVQGVWPIAVRSRRWQLELPPPEGFIEKKNAGVNGRTINYAFPPIPVSCETEIYNLVGLHYIPWFKRSVLW